MASPDAGELLTTRINNKVAVFGRHAAAWGIIGTVLEWSPPTFSFAGVLYAAFTDPPNNITVAIGAGIVALLTALHAGLKPGERAARAGRNKDTWELFRIQYMNGLNDIEHRCTGQSDKVTTEKIAYTKDMLAESRRLL